MKSLCASVFVALLLAGPVRSQQKPNDAPGASNLPPTTTQVLKFMEVIQVRQRLQSGVQAEQEQIKTVVHNMFHKALPMQPRRRKRSSRRLSEGSLRGCSQTTLSRMC